MHSPVDMNSKIGGWSLQRREDGSMDRIVVRAGSTKRSCLPLEIALGGFAVPWSEVFKALGVAEAL